MHDAHTHLVVPIKPQQGAVQCLYGALHVSLHHDIQVLQLSLLNLVEQVIQRNLLGVNHLIALLLHALLSNGTGLLLLQGCQLITGGRHIVQAQHLYRHGRACLLHVLAPVVEHGAYLAVGSASHDGVTDAQGT